MKRCFFSVLLVLLALASPPAHAIDVMTDSSGMSWFPVLPFDAPPDASPQLVPIAANHPLSGDHAGLTRAIIVIHDYSRDAQSTLGVMSGLAGMGNAATLILAPQFLIDFDVQRLTAQLPGHTEMFARWSIGGWAVGNDSDAKPPQKAVSSFTVMDLLLMYLSDKKFFPDLQQIVVAGHGAGGDFVQRYAAMGRAVDILEKQKTPLRFVVANASSYLYFTPLRPKSGKQPGFGTADAAACPDFNTYSYGLDKPNDYAKRIGPSAIQLGYADRVVTYLIGEKAAVSDPLPDTSCAAMLEGPDRGKRLLNYNGYLYQIFGESLSRNQRFITVPKAGYDAVALFSSPCATSALFGDGSCNVPAVKSPSN